MLEKGRTAGIVGRGESEIGIDWENKRRGIMDFQVQFNPSFDGFLFYSVLELYNLKISHDVQD